MGVSLLFMPNIDEISCEDHSTQSSKSDIEPEDDDEKEDNDMRE